MKSRWLAVLLAVILVTSYVSTNFTLLNPANGVWESINGSSTNSYNVKVSGLQSPVTVTIDSSGVAHINASSAHASRIRVIGCTSIESPTGCSSCSRERRRA